MKYSMGTAFHGAVIHVFDVKPLYYPQANENFVRALCGRSKLTWYAPLSYLRMCKSCDSVKMERIYNEKLNA